MGNTPSASGSGARAFARTSSPRRRESTDPAHLFVKPSGLYPTCQWDDRVVRRLILRRELAPRFPGKDDPSEEAREECPICMLMYPMLNATRCCMQRICTECYLQLRPPRHNKEPCPFCKRRKVEVTFHGPRPSQELDKEEASRSAALAAQKRTRDCPIALSAETPAHAASLHFRTCSALAVPKHLQTEQEEQPREDLQRQPLYPEEWQRGTQDSQQEHHELGHSSLAQIRYLEQEQTPPVAPLHEGEPMLTTACSDHCQSPVVSSAGATGTNSSIVRRMGSSRLSVIGGSSGCLAEARVEDTVQPLTNSKLETGCESCHEAESDGARTCCVRSRTRGLTEKSEIVGCMVEPLAVDVIAVADRSQPNASQSRIMSLSSETSVERRDGHVPVVVPFKEHSSRRTVPSGHSPSPLPPLPPPRDSSDDDVDEMQTFYLIPLGTHGEASTPPACFL